MKKTLSLAIAALCLTATAQAHQVWIEQSGGKSAIARFGEFAENLREASPGYLDGFGKMSASLVSAKGESPLTVTKTADGFTLSGKASGNESLVLDSPMDTLRKFKHGGESINAWFHMSARYVANPSAAVAPKLTLDIVPTGQAGEFQVVLKGQPLPKAKLVAMVDSGWEKRPTLTRKARRASTCRGRRNTSCAPCISTRRRASGRAPRGPSLTMPSATWQP